MLGDQHQRAGKVPRACKRLARAEAAASSAAYDSCALGSRAGRWGFAIDVASGATAGGAGRSGAEAGTGGTMRGLDCGDGSGRGDPAAEGGGGAGRPDEQSHGRRQGDPRAPTARRDRRCAVSRRRRRHGGARTRQRARPHDVRRGRDYPATLQERLQLGIEWTLIALHLRARSFNNRRTAAASSLRPFRNLAYVPNRVMDNLCAMSATGTPSRSCITTTARRRKGTRSRAANKSAIDSFDCSEPSGLAAPSSTLERRIRDLAGAPPAVRADDPERHAEKVGAEGTGRVEGRPVPVQHHEYFLREIFDLTRCRAEPSQRLEQIVELTLERREATALGRGKGRAGTHGAEIAHRSLPIVSGARAVHRNRTAISAPNSAARRGAVQTGIASRVTIPWVIRARPSACAPIWKRLPSLCVTARRRPSLGHDPGRRRGKVNSLTRPPESRRPFRPGRRSRAGARRNPPNWPRIVAGRTPPRQPGASWTER